MGREGGKVSSGKTGLEGRRRIQRRGQTECLNVWGLHMGCWLAGGGDEATVVVNGRVRA